MSARLLPAHAVALDVRGGRQLPGGDVREEGRSCTLPSRWLPAPKAARCPIACRNVTPRSAGRLRSVSHGGRELGRRPARRCREMLEEMHRDRGGGGDL